VDDGYLDTFSVAYPLLHRHDFPATLFLVSDHVGDENRWDDPGLLKGRALMSWAEIRAMLRGGMSIGAHTRSHPVLTAVTPEQAGIEIAGSRAELERELGRPVQLFSYPHGKYDAKTRSLVEQAGYLGACTTRPGMNTLAVSDFEIRRTEVYGTDSVLRFVLALWLGDDLLPPRRGRQK